VGHRGRWGERGEAALEHAPPFRIERGRRLRAISGTLSA
jgi:hypothetical protein